MYKKRNALIIVLLSVILFCFQFSVHTLLSQTYTGICKLDTGKLHIIDERIEQALTHYEYINVALVQDGDIVFTKSYGKNRLNKYGVFSICLKKYEINP